MKRRAYGKGLVILVTTLFFSLTMLPAIGTLKPITFQNREFEKERVSLQNYELPPPIPVNMTLEESIFRRCSIRVFSDDPVTDEELSTVLWAAYGYINEEKRTVHGIEGIYAARIYVLKEDAVYIYDPLNHSLIFYKEGDYRGRVAQYEAPIQLGIVWDKNKSSNENYAAAEIGEIGQNIYFMANALDLGTVTTVGFTLSRIGLPSNEVAKIIMPLGHPKYPYNFVYRPLVLSPLPRIQYSNMSLTTAIEERRETDSFEGELTKQEKTQVIWSTYGYSYFLDKTEDEFFYHINRHRTVPSAHGYYPLRIYAITESGIYRYIPNIYDPIYGILPLAFLPIPMPVFTFMMKVKGGDYREEIAQASLPSIASAPLSIISVLDIERTRPKNFDDFSGEEYRWLWYYEAGASAYNVLLEATAWNLSANVFPITNKEAILSVLGLDGNDFDPLFIVPVGK
ncbi:MAG: hypothetical protein FE048_02885 [Thermoplasmata archaeon]|nr:MAG: hypothetical protein FE048_02885 [Thermoplasmata archaeon]